MSTSRQASSDPDPPKVVSMKSRTSSPRLTDTWRSALAWFHAEISRMPVAQRSSSSPSRAASDRMPSPRRLHVERDLAAEQVRGDPAEHDVRVGDGRLGAALAVAERAGVGAGRLRPHLERALGRDPGDRPAAGPHGDDVDHRDLARVGADRALGGEGRLAVEHDRHVGRGAAAVAGEHPGEAGAPGDQRRPQRPGRRPGQHGGDRLVHHLVGRQHPAVRLHHVEGDRAPAGEPVEPGVDVADVAADVRLDGGVDQGGHRPLVLAVLAQHLGADRHHGVRVLTAQHLAHRQLVLVVGVGVQEAHPDRGDVVVAEPAGGGHGIRLVERAQLVALEVHPAADGAHVVGGDDARRLDPEVGVAVAVGHGLAGDLEHELVALGGDEARGARPCPRAACWSRRSCRGRPR